MAGDLTGADAVIAVSKAFSQGSQKSLLFSAAFQASPSPNSSPEVVPLAQLGSPGLPHPRQGNPSALPGGRGKEKGVEEGAKQVPALAPAQAPAPGQ